MRVVAINCEFSLPHLSVGGHAGGYIRIREAIKSRSSPGSLGGEERKSLGTKLVFHTVPAPIDSLSFKYSLAELFRKNWSNTGPIIELALSLSTSP